MGTVVSFFPIYLKIYFRGTNTCIHLTLDKENEVKHLNHANEIQRRKADFVGSVGRALEGFQRKEEYSSAETRRVIPSCSPRRLPCARSGYMVTLSALELIR